MRLIDANRLLTDRMKSKYYHLPNGDIAIPIIDIEHAPTIDAVEVVRCKDCKKAKTKDCSHSYWDDDWGMFRVGYNGDDWYCADGEREESEVEE